MADLLASRIGVNPTQLIRVAGYPMDLAISESHSFPGEATKYPVEAGADISDHIRDLPIEITLECLVSDLVPSQVAGDSQRGQTTPDGEIVLPSEEALAVLRDLKERRQTVVIETSLGRFESMAFISLDVPKDKDKNNALFFTAKFHKINKVTNTRTRVRVRSDLAGAGGKAKVKVLTATGIQIIKTIVWRHGVPPGSPWRKPEPDHDFPGDPVELVNVGYVKPAGVPNNQLPGLIDEQLRYEELGYQTGAVRFIDTNGEQITGARLSALRLDLRRDRVQLNSNNPNFSPSGAFTPDQARGPNGATGFGRVSKSLPPGIDTSKWSQPSGTFISEAPRGPNGSTGFGAVGGG